MTTSSDACSFEARLWANTVFPTPPAAWMSQRPDVPALERKSASWTRSTTSPTSGKACGVGSRSLSSAKPSTARISTLTTSLLLCPCGPALFLMSSRKSPRRARATTSREADQSAIIAALRCSTLSSPPALPLNTRREQNRLSRSGGRSTSP